MEDEEEPTAEELANDPELEEIVRDAEQNWDELFFRRYIKQAKKATTTNDDRSS